MLIVQDGSQSDGGTFDLLLELNENGSFVGLFGSVGRTFAGNLTVLSQYYMLTAVSDSWVGSVKAGTEQHIQIDRNSGGYVGRYISWSDATGVVYEQHYYGVCALNSEKPKL